MTPIRPRRYLDDLRNQCVQMSIVCFLTGWLKSSEGRSHLLNHMREWSQMFGVFPFRLLSNVKSVPFRLLSILCTSSSLIQPVHIMYYFDGAKEDFMYKYGKKVNAYI